MDHSIKAPECQECADLDESNLEARISMMDENTSLKAEVAALKAERWSCHEQVEDVIRNCQRGSETMGMSAAGIQNIVANLKNTLK